MSSTIVRQKCSLTRSRYFKTKSPRRSINVFGHDNYGKSDGQMPKSEDKQDLEVYPARRAVLAQHARKSCRDVQVALRGCGCQGAILPS